MPGFIDAIKNNINTIKEIFAALREAILVIVLILLLIWPATFNGILVKAGFTEADFGFIKWKRQLQELVQQTREANELVNVVQEDLETINQELESTPRGLGGDEKALKERAAIARRISKTSETAQTARQKLAENLRKQEELLNEIQKAEERR